MEEVIKNVGNWVIWLVSVGGALAAMYGWLVKPIRDIGRKLDVVQADTGDLMGDRLVQGHDYWMRKGYCPKADKRRLIDMHKRYADLGRNHIASEYEQDLLELPEEPPGGERR